MRPPANDDARGQGGRRRDQEIERRSDYTAVEGLVDLRALLCEGALECLAEALALYVIANRDSHHDFEGEPYDADDALDLARELCLLPKVRDALTEQFLSRDAEISDERANRDDLIRRLAAFDRPEFLDHD